MTMKDIEYIIEIAEAKSISKAAQNLYISQPDLSVSIRSIEQELGNDLFIRTKRGIEVTDFGYQVLDCFYPIYNQFLQVQETCHSIALKERQRFSVSSVSLKFVNNVFLKMYENYADEKVSFNYLEGTTSGVIENVVSQRAEIGIIIFSSFQQMYYQRLLRHKGLQYGKLSTEPPHIIISSKNPFYNKDIADIDIKEMASFPFIASYSDSLYNFSDGAPLAAEVSQLMRSCNVFVSNRACLYDFLHNTNGYSISSNNANTYKQNPAYANIKAIPIRNPKFTFEIGWIKLERFQLSQMAEVFLQEIIKLMNGNE
ncbi:MAG: LysR family transcriptional regulator [Oscillospiraceae bacterium]|nr:LysR family transcriptional regulator [Oscillospiraceae bacterium]